MPLTEHFLFNLFKRFTIGFNDMFFQINKSNKSYNCKKDKSITHPKLLCSLSRSKKADCQWEKNLNWR